MNTGQFACSQFSVTAKWELFVMKAVGL